MIPERSGYRSETAFLRILACILFFPCFLIMDQSLPVQVYYIAGVALGYSFLAYFLPRLGGMFNGIASVSFFVDLTVITSLLYYLDQYTYALATLYILPLISFSLKCKPAAIITALLLTGGAYLFIVFYKKLYLSPALLQYVIFIIITFITSFISQDVQQAYFRHANMDTLTKISNRRLFNHTIRALVKNRMPFSLILLDLDNFKNLNDTQGHHHGDYVLKIIASILKECTRSTDIVSRYGGDEFAVLLPRTSKEISKNIAERIRNNVIVNPKLASYPFIGTSIGIASYPEDANSEEEIQKRADAALYHAKNMGKNYVSVYKPDNPTTP